MSDDPGLSRKQFVIAGASVAAAIASREAASAAPETVAVAKTAHQPAMKAAPPALAERPEAYAFFTPPEIAFVEAAVERLIPTDRHGAGGKAAGCAYYIDQQLFGRYGRGDTMYTHAPWAPALPTQGYQLKFTPADAYRLGIEATNALTKKTYGKTFDKLDGAHQDAVLTALQKGTATFSTVPATVFFGMLLGDTIQGFFADPMYGGNRDNVGWKTIGFPGVGAVYLETIDQVNKPYHVAPKGIADDLTPQMAMHGAQPVRHVPTRLAARELNKELS